jgi:hypothetical protein
LGTDHRDIGEAVTAERDRGRDIEEHLARIMLSACRPPWRQRSRQTTTQARHPDRFLDQQGTRRRDQQLADGIENHIRDTATLHLRSAFHSVTLSLRKPKFSVLDRHFRASRAAINYGHVKSRG